MMTHEELEEAVPLYAIGALDRPERQALEAHLLSGCATCHAALKDYQGVAALLPFGLNPAVPPRTLKAKVMASRTSGAVVSSDEKQAARSSLEPGDWMNHLFPPINPVRSWTLQLALGFASVLLLAGIGFVAWNAYSRNAREAQQIDQLQTALQREALKVTALQKDTAEREKVLRQAREELDLQRNDLTELRETLVQREAELDNVRTLLSQRDASMQRLVRQQEEFSALLKSPHAKVVALSGSELAKESGAFLLFDPVTKKAWLYAFNLPALPSGKVYQLWAIDEKPVSAGVFNPDPGQKGRLMIRNLPDFSRMKTFAISVEPTGGRPQPTGAIYLMGQT
ncbi:MAG TPA: anti-sigma factor [Nitrospiraceae bacterium]|nr:anti-sigma factor [Nitrospiraceae bacterium]